MAPVYTVHLKLVLGRLFQLLGCGGLDSWSHIMTWHDMGRWFLTWGPPGPENSQNGSMNPYTKMAHLLHQPWNQDRGHCIVSKGSMLCFANDNIVRIIFLIRMELYFLDLFERAYCKLEVFRERCLREWGQFKWHHSTAWKAYLGSLTVVLGI